MSSFSDIAVTDCEVCNKGLAPGDMALYHSRLGVWIHCECLCLAEILVRGEDISTHAMFGRQI